MKRTPVDSARDWQASPARRISACEHLPVAERVMLRLRTELYSDLQVVSCYCEEESVVLEGDLPTFFLKQVAQEVAKTAVGTERIVNRIRVKTRANRA